MAPRAIRFVASAIRFTAVTLVVQCSDAWTEALFKRYLTRTK